MGPRLRSSTAVAATSSWCPGLHHMRYTDAVLSRCVCCVCFDASRPLYATLELQWKLSVPSEDNPFHLTDSGSAFRNTRQDPRGGVRVGGHLGSMWIVEHTTASTSHTAPFT